MTALKIVVLAGLLVALALHVPALDDYGSLLFLAVLFIIVEPSVAPSSHHHHY